MSAGNAAAHDSLRNWQRWVRFDHTIWMVYLVFWPIEPYVTHAPLSQWLWLLLALGIFIPCYFLAHFGPRRLRWIPVLAMMVLGMAYVPFNGGACGAFIYVATAIPEVTEATGTVLTLLLVECAVIIAEAWWLHLSGWVWSMGMGFSLVFGMNQLRVKQKQRSDSRLRMAQEEIEQLAKSAERERIARDMHDVLGHSLSLIVLKSELAGRMLAVQPARAALEIAEIEIAAREALAEVRKTITGYRSEGFAAELTRAAQVLATAGVLLQKPVKPPQLTPRQEATLSLVLREAVTNIVRHASAGACSIEVDAMKGGTRLVIADDGRGGIRQEGNGLRGMRERVQEAGGSLSLESERGTRLQVDLPHPGDRLPGGEL